MTRNKLFLSGILTLPLVFGLVLTGCYIGSNDNGHSVRIYAIAYGGDKFVAVGGSMRLPQTA
jgi:hypothetical protein